LLWVIFLFYFLFSFPHLMICIGN